MGRSVSVLAAGLLAISVTGCAGVAGAGIAGGAYEYQNKKQLDELEGQFKAGEITREEYIQRKEQIQSGSVLY